MTIRNPHPAPAPSAGGPVRSTPLSERSLAPDLARGMMLLLIALAHVPWFIYDAPAGLALLHPADGNLADRIAQAFTVIIVDARAYTMFGFLFAYGVGQLYARQMSRGAGPADARRLLRRRHLWMLLFGAVHALLLWQGDIIGTYGLIGLIMVPLFLNRSDRTLKAWIAVLLAAGALYSAATAAAGLVAPAADAVPVADVQRMSIAETGYLPSAAIRLSDWGAVLVSGLFTFALPTAFLIGLLAARHRLLDEPARHLPLLRRLAVAGISVGWLAGLPLALQHIGAIAPAYVPVFSGLHLYAGIFTGVGYAALFGLIAHWIATRGRQRSLPVRALVSLGRRSMSGYLAQSLVWGPVLAAWGLGLGVYLSSWSAMLVAVATWLVTVAVAYALDRTGRRGPAEVLLRGLTYRAVRSGND
ncbi:DUF418 domain-containing protein [Nocardiopsis sediminis]|uniref:DUF418 domain-containing protein n=1 Tax=Nocardiopsis sediminis TaxID=1778267 RepID=A0ABV8FNX2_9ACTN